MQKEFQDKQQPESASPKRGRKKATARQISDRALIETIMGLSQRMGELYARMTNLEILLHVRENSLQSIEGISFPGGFSRAAYESVLKSIQAELLAPLARGDDGGEDSGNNSG